MKKCVTLYCWNVWIPYRKSAALCIFNHRHQKCSHSVHQKIPKEYNVILTSLSILTKLSIFLRFWWHWHVHWHKGLLLRNGLDILSKLQAFAGHPLCGAVCNNCFEKSTYWFANVNDSRNVPKRLRKAVIKRSQQNETLTNFANWAYMLLYNNAIKQTVLLLGLGNMSTFSNWHCQPSKQQLTIYSAFYPFIPSNS